MKRMAPITVVLLMLLTSAPASAQRPAAVERQLVALEHQAADAIVKHDRTTLERFFADDYVFIDEGGNVANKTRDMAVALSNDLKLKSITYENDLKVRLYSNVGIVTGTYQQSGTYQGKDASGTYRFTDVFARTRSGWRCVSSHQSRVVDK